MNEQELVSNRVNLQRQIQYSVPEKIQKKLIVKNTLNMFYFQTVTLWKKIEKNENTHMDLNHPNGLREERQNYLLSDPRFSDLLFIYY